MVIIKKEKETKKEGLWRCRWANSLGQLEDTAENVWGTKPYNPDTDIDLPCVFFGLYGLPDFYALWRHKGQKHILWTGSDITHFRNGYWLDKNGFIRIDPEALVAWINVNCTNWVENEVEFRALNNIGLKCEPENIVPSFLGDVNQFEVSFKPGNKVYTSVSGDNFELYGWNKIGNLSISNPEIEFHLYGNKNIYVYQGGWPNNVKIHGRVPKEQMNEEIKDMQGALRLTEFDGFSEILAKSVLMGQWPVSLIEYPHMLSISELSSIKDKKEPNNDGRSYYKSIINKYLWNQKK